MRRTSDGASCVNADNLNFVALNAQFCHVCRVR